MGEAFSGLRDLALILRSDSPTPKVIERRASQVSRDLVERTRHLESGDPLIDSIKAAQSLLGCLTVDGRAIATSSAMTKATELGERLSKEVSGFEVTNDWLKAEAARLERLAKFDRAMLQQTADEFDLLAERLSPFTPKRS